MGGEESQCGARAGRRFRLGGTPSAGPGAKQMTRENNAPDVYEKIATRLLEDGVADGHVIIGPILGRPSDGTAGRIWYFQIISRDIDGGLCFVKFETRNKDVDRAGLIAALKRRTPIVVHVVDDGLVMARLCESLWPCERTSRLREDFEAASPGSLNRKERKNGEEPKVPPIGGYCLESLC